MDTAYIAFEETLEVQAEADLTLALRGDFSANEGDVIELISYGGTRTGAFGDLEEGEEINLGDYVFSFTFGGGSDDAVALTVLEAPEPSPAMSFDDWCGQHFYSEKLGDESISGPAGDPDGDGVVYLMEFALAGDPPPSLEVLPAIGEVNVEGIDYLTITFSRPADSDGVTYAVEVSDDLVAWTPGGTLSDSEEHGDMIVET